MSGASHSQRWSSTLAIRIECLLGLAQRWPPRHSPDLETDKVNCAQQIREQGQAGLAMHSHSWQSLRVPCCKSSAEAAHPWSNRCRVSLGWPFGKHLPSILEKQPLPLCAAAHVSLMWFCHLRIGAQTPKAHTLLGITARAEPTTHDVLFNSVSREGERPR